MPSRLWNLVAGTSPTAADEWPADLESGGRVEDHDDIRRVIEACCQARAEAIVLSFEDQVVCPMHFLEMGDDVFRLTVDGDLPPLLRPPTQCSVSLRFGQRNRVFIATVLAVRPGERSGGALELVLRIPGEIAAGDPRMAFRVPILRPADLALELRVDGDVMEDVRPLNLSLIGMLVEPPPDGASIDDHAKLEVVLQHGKVRVSLRAELRRRYERGLALFFPDVLDDGSLEPPDELRTIVRDLELLWLRQRTR